MSRTLGIREAVFKSFGEVQGQILKFRYNNWNEKKCEKLLVFCSSELIFHPFDTISLFEFFVE